MGSMDRDYMHPYLHEKKDYNKKSSSSVKKGKTSSGNNILSKLSRKIRNIFKRT
jgi:hypothetical protein